MKRSAIYAITVGILMLGQWGFFLATGAVPELKTEPLRIALHLAAELLTASALVAGGAALLHRRPWGRPFTLFALGMLAYATVVSSGYFAQLDQWPLVLMFAVVFAGTVGSAWAVCKPA